MAIDLQSLGSKLFKYREQLGASIQEVSLATGIEYKRLASIESGTLEPTGDEILILADHFRCDYRFFISDERVAPFEQTETLYRSSGSAFTSADRRAIQEFLYLCDTEAFLMEALGRPTKYFVATPLPGGKTLDPATAAVQARAALGYADTVAIPDVYGAFRELGVHVFRRRLGNSNISGLFVTHPVAGKCALVNSSEDIYRQRFSASHEMAHAIFDSDQTASVSLTTDKADPREVRANKFASNFLMPKSFLKRLPAPHNWTDDDAIQWANKLKVSCAALAYALNSAKVIRYEQCERMAKLQIPRDWKIDPELPDTLTQAQRDRKSRLLDLGLSDFYVQLCFDALQQGVISLGRLCEALLCSPSEMTELSSLYGRSTHVR